MLTRTDLHLQVGTEVKVRILDLGADSSPKRPQGFFFKKDVFSFEEQTRCLGKRRKPKEKIRPNELRLFLSECSLVLPVN